MTDEPIRVTYTVEDSQAKSALESLNAAMMRISESAMASGQAIDRFVSQSISSLGRLSAEISRVSGELRSMGAGAPGVSTGGANVPPGVPPIQPVPPPAPPVPPLPTPADSGGSRSLGNLQRELNDARRAFDGSTGSVKRLQSAYGEYNTTLESSRRATGELGMDLQKTSTIFERQLTRIAIGVAIWTTFRSVQQVIQEQITALREYELEVSRFAAITGQSVDSARAKWDEYAAIATQAGVKPMEAASTIRIAELTPGGTDQTREQFIRTVTQLEEVTGVSSDKIGKGLSSALKQAGKDLGEVAHMGDLVATTLQRIPAANLDNVISALQEAAPLAQLWGVEFDEAFNIIVEGAARVQESPEQISTAFQRLSKGINEIGQGGSAAWERQNKLLNDFGVQINNVDTGRLRPIPEILGEISRILPSLSAPRQQDLLETVAGGSLRPEQMRNILGGITAFDTDLSGSIDKLNGTLNKMTDVIDKSLGQTVKVLDARIAQMREKGDLISNLATSLLRGTIGEYGGKQGAEATTGFINLTTAGQQGQSGKQPFLDKIVKEAGGDIEKARALAKEHNDAVYNAVKKEFEGRPFNPVEIAAGYNYEEGLRISDDELVRAIQEGKSKIGAAVNEPIDAGGGKASADAVEAITQPQLQALDKWISELSSRRDVVGELAQALLSPFQKDIRAKAAGMQAPATTASGGGMDTTRQPALSEYAQKIKSVMSSQEGTLTGEDFFPNMDTVIGQFDATKMTVDEINQAKQESVLIVQQELELHRQFLESQGLEPALIEAIVKMEKERLELSYLQVDAKGKLIGLTGLEAARFQQAAGKQSQRKQESESDFAFQRHKDVDPSQFPQLQALAQMYNQMLTQMGSPEKNKNINLLLGEDNVFKTMNVRMTALQLALEDLNKTEKAQLSGTWNMPAGATALVPISSLDVQRWNKADGGGLSAEAIRALLDATAGSGDQVSTSMQTAASRIVQAIQESFDKVGLPMDKVNQAKTPAEAVQAARETFMERVSAGMDAKDKAFEMMSRTLGTRREVSGGADGISGAVDLLAKKLALQAASISGGGRFGAFAAGGGGGGADEAGGGGERQRSSELMARQPAQVSISALPIKAVFNANLSVVLNGAIVARAVMPILYQMLSRLTASTGQRPKGVQR